MYTKTLAVLFALLVTAAGCAPVEQEKGEDASNSSSSMENASENSSSSVENGSETK